MSTLSEILKKAFRLFSYFHYLNVAVAVLFFKIVNPNFFSVQESVSRKCLKMLNCLKRCQTHQFILLCVPPRATLKWKSCLKRVRWSDKALKRFRIVFLVSSPEATQAIQKTQFKHWVLCIYVLVFFLDTLASGIQRHLKYFFLSCCWKNRIF